MIDGSGVLLNLRKTRVIVTDVRLVTSGHTSNKAACIAISTCVQTFARLAYSLGLLAADVEVDAQHGLHDVLLLPVEESRAMLTGVLSSLQAIAKECPGTMELADHRKQAGLIIDRTPPAPEAEAENPTGSYAETFEAARREKIRVPGGKRKGTLHIVKA